VTAEPRAVIEPLHPSHDVAAFRCNEAQYLVSELHSYADNSSYVVGQRVLVSVVDNHVTGFLSLGDVQIAFADQPGDDAWHCLFVTSMAVSDDRRNTHHAVDLVVRAFECIEPAERFSGLDYQAIVIQPGTNPDLIAAAERMGFRRLRGGFWGRELRRRKAGLHS